MELKNCKHLSILILTLNKHHLSFDIIIVWETSIGYFHVSVFQKFFTNTIKIEARPNYTEAFYA